MNAEDSRPDDVHELVDQLSDTDGGPKMRVRDVLDRVRGRSYGPLILIPALIALSPIGAIPGASIVTGTILVLLCVQMLFGKEHPWVPSKILNLEFDRARFERGIEKCKPWAKRIDRFLRPRLSWLCRPPMRNLTAALCVALAASMYPLAIVPFGVMLPAAALTIFGLALTLEDGLLALLAWLLSGGVAWTLLQVM